MSPVQNRRRIDALPDLLTREQEVELALRIEAGVLAQAVLDGELVAAVNATVSELRELAEDGAEARRHFLAANIRMVAAIAGEATSRSAIEYDELFQDGCVALAEALNRYDALSGVRFASYAWGWVRNAVAECQLRRGGQAMQSVWRARQAVELRRRRREMELLAGREVGVRELAQDVGRDLSWVELALVADLPATGGIDLTRLPLECEATTRRLEQCERVRPVWLGQLPSVEARLLALRYGLDDDVERSFDECARRLGLSVSTVRRMERSALARARGLAGTTADRELVAA